MRATVPDEWRGRRVDLLWATTARVDALDRRTRVQGLHGIERTQRPDATVLVTRARRRAASSSRSSSHATASSATLEAPARARASASSRSFDEDAWRLYHDFELLRALEASDTLEPSWAGHLRAELNRFCNERDPAILAALYEHHNGTRAHEVAAIGHAHIDTAWLWPLAETYRKLVRTFSSQTRYMDEYPEFRFACSQAQQYAWIKERNPDLWERIRAKVETGQFVPVGGSWVEPDCNIPSGESLLRQFVHGQRFFEDEFGDSLPRVLVTGRVRLLRPAAAADAPRRASRAS